MNNAQIEIPQDIERLTKLMDDKYEFLGFRFGLNLFIDLLPELGDVITTVIALYIFYLAQKYTNSKWIKFRMLLNIFIYFMIGLIPYLGDLFGVWFKPNRRNLKLLTKNL